MKEGGKLCRQERRLKKSCDVNSLTQLFFEKHSTYPQFRFFNATKNHVFNVHSSCAVCAWISTLRNWQGQAGVSQWQFINTAACFLMSSGLFLFLFSVLSGRCVSMRQLSLPGDASLQAGWESDYIWDPAKGWCVTDLCGILGCDIAPLLMYMKGLFAWKSNPVQKKKSWNFLIMGRSKAKYMYLKFFKMLFTIYRNVYVQKEEH